jgi:hypothetical protein
MKKIAIIALAVLCAASFSTAAGRISFGIKAGMNRANMVTTDADFEWSARWMPAGGAFLRFSLSDYFCIQPEVLYSPKGAQYEMTDGTTTITAKVSAPYIDVPILLMLLLPTGTSDGVRPFVFAGPYIGFKAGAGKMKTDITYGGQTDTSEDTLTSLKSTDFGFVLGAGVEFPLDSMKISLDVRWATSLATISKEVDDTRNKVWTFLLGISF